MSTRVERYLAYLDSLSDVEPRFHRADSTHDGLPAVHAIVYDDTPEPGMLTALTYGLSLADHDEWTGGKPELCIAVNSRDDAWALAVAYLAEQLRGTAPFCYGDTIDFGEQVSPESDMTAFIVFAPIVLDREASLDIDVGDPLPINISGIYPIHDVERLWIHEHGLEAFWNLEWDPYDVGRPPAVG